MRGHVGVDPYFNQRTQLFHGYLLANLTSCGKSVMENPSHKLTIIEDDTSQIHSVVFGSTMFNYNISGSYQVSLYSSSQQIKYP